MFRITYDEKHAESEILNFLLSQLPASRRKALLSQRHRIRAANIRAPVKANRVPDVKDLKLAVRARQARAPTVNPDWADEAPRATHAPLGEVGGGDELISSTSSSSEEEEEEAV